MFTSRQILLIILFHATTQGFVPPATRQHHYRHVTILFDNTKKRNGYKFGDLTKSLLGPTAKVLTGTKEEYKFGDITNGAVKKAPDAVEEISGKDDRLSPPPTTAQTSVQYSRTRRLKLVMGWFGSRKDNETKFVTCGLSYFIQISPDILSKLKHAMTGYSTSQKLFIGSACTAAFVLGFRAGRLRPMFRRFSDVTEIPSSDLGSSAPWLRGRVVSVSDGDTFRFWHIPSPLHASKPDSKVKLSEQTLPIRICTIDTPETAKFGKPGQPFGKDAKDYLSTLLLDKKCEIQLLTKDQYGRAVGRVRRRCRFRYTYVDEYMLNAGLAEVYLGNGAVYGSKGKDYYLELQDQAQKAKKGQWSQENRESAADYKARTK
jgi:micrococcal nuclease